MVIGSDTMVFKENKIYGKPKNKEEAYKMLEDLQGGMHKVISSLCVLIEKEGEYKEFQYTPNLKRPISIIDPETTEEIKPVLYRDKETNEIKGKCKLKPYKSYFSFEIRDKKD